MRQNSTASGLSDEGRFTGRADACDPADVGCKPTKDAFTKEQFIRLCREVVAPVDVDAGCRQQITAEVVQEADGMLASGFDPATIARRLGLSEYVVNVMAGDTHRDGRYPPTRPKTRRVFNACHSIDAGTIRMIRRMLAAGVLCFREIAHEVGVSEATVRGVACGQRRLGECVRPQLEEGEAYVPEGQRCPQCGALIVVVPCRACQIRADCSSA